MVTCKAICSCKVSKKTGNLFLFKARSPSHHNLGDSIGNKPELSVYDIKVLPCTDKTDQEENSNQSAIAPGNGEERLRRAKIIILE